MSRPRVLVVEDARVVSFLLTRNLEAAGYAVTVSADGLDALEVASTRTLISSLSGAAPGAHKASSEVVEPVLAGAVSR